MNSFSRCLGGRLVLINRNLFASPNFQARTMFGKNRHQNFDPTRDFLALIRDMERSFNHVYQDFGRSWKMPHALPLNTSNNGSHLYRLNIDMSDFKPEDIKVSLNDKLLTIQAKTEHKGEDGSRFYQETSREYLLPDKLNVEELKSMLSDDGVLRFEAPLPEQNEKPLEIPITRDTPPKELK